MEFEELNAEQMAASAPAPEKAKIINPPASQEKLKREFEPMQYVSNPIVLPKGCYRVFENKIDFTEVVAGSAYEAMQKSNIREPHLIQRFSLNQMKVLTRQLLEHEMPEDDDMLSEAEEVTEAAPPTEEPVQPEQEAAPTPQEPAEEGEGLSEEEVQRLLNEEENAS